MGNENFNTNIENKDEWLTPPEIIKDLGEFDLDPCAPLEEKRPWDTATKHYTINDDGLNQDWIGRVWCNPPYGNKTFEWLSKLAEHSNGIALIFARTETKGFHSQIWERANAIFFFKGRLSFYHVTGIKGNAANAPSCLVAYGQNNVESLKKYSETHKGKFIYLEQKELIVEDVIGKIE